jgi:hypothetical protein
MMEFIDSHLIGLSDADNSTIYTAKTPPETVTSDLVEEKEQPLIKPSTSSSSVPWPGSTYIIRSTSTSTSGHVITLLEGQVLLEEPGGRGSSYWDCIEKDGWLGFRNPVSGNLLGHDDAGKLRCFTDRQGDWEYFCVRMRPEGGFVLLLRDGHRAERLWQLGVKVEMGMSDERWLGKIEGTGGIAWEFVKV